MRSYLLVFLALFVAITVLCFSRCTSQDEMLANRPAAVVTYCGNCHQVPSPKDLTRKLWISEMLPRMGAYYGVYSGSYRRSSLLRDRASRPYIEHLYPSTPTIDSASWEAIRTYFIGYSEDVLSMPASNPRQAQLEEFELRAVYDTSSAAPIAATTMIQYDEQQRRIIVGQPSGRGGMLRLFSPEGKLLKVLKTPSTPSEYLAENKHLLCMGSLNPSDYPTGKLISLSNDSALTLLDTLARPVDVQEMDLNGDGNKEIIVAEYGNLVGYLNIYEKIGQGYRLKQTIAARPGAIQLEQADLDLDGLPDLVILNGQGLEGISVLQSSKAYAEEQSIIAYPPSYGSAYMKIIDFDLDGDLDIIYVNGDNFDYQPIPKPYHGIRFLENDGKGDFTETWFYHLDGAYGVEVADFDGDGDLDIAAIAYFVPPELRSNRSFVYLEQTGKPAKPAFIEKPLLTSPGMNFLRMTSADVDQDGDQDLLLGNYAAYLPDGNMGKRILPDSTAVYFLLRNKLVN